MEENKVKTLIKEFINFDIYEKKEIIAMLKAQDLVSSLDKISNEVFRPARKHGYNNSEIEKLIERCGEDEEGYNNGCELISLLETEFYKILEERGVSDLLL